MTGQLRNCCQPGVECNAIKVPGIILDSFVRALGYSCPSFPARGTSRKKILRFTPSSARTQASPRAVEGYGYGFARDHGLRRRNWEYVLPPCLPPPVPESRSPVLPPADPEPSRPELCSSGGRRKRVPPISTCLSGHLPLSSSSSSYGDTSISSPPRLAASGSGSALDAATRLRDFRALIAEMRAAPDFRDDLKEEGGRGLMPGIATTLTTTMATTTTTTREENGSEFSGC
ncbi:hypothetical protein BC826DRAFT_1149524 [Russula brevipes]|nr:hypothetical protein BC826DRAFT_1149524 [Russula brevipes]